MNRTDPARAPACRGDFSRIGVIAALAGALVLLGACSGGSDRGASQVAAKVNGSEITVHQINHILRRSRGVTEENAPQARKQILEQLIRQELLVEQAQAMKLDRDPQILLALEAARRDILARAYLERRALAAEKPDAAAISAYYAENPALFRNRRVYRFNEFTLSRLPADAAGFLDELGKAASLADAVAVVRKAGGDVTVSSNVARASEQLPRDLLPKLAAASVGSVHVYRMGNVLVVGEIRESVAAPVTEDQAKATIEQILLGRERQEAAASDVERLRTSAEVAYLGEFASEPASAPASDAAGAGIETPLAEGAPGAATGSGVSSFSVQ